LRATVGPSTHDVARRNDPDDFIGLKRRALGGLEVLRHLNFFRRVARNPFVFETEAEEVPEDLELS
jgi:hypothetical protein